MIHRHLRQFALYSFPTKPLPQPETEALAGLAQAAPVLSRKDVDTLVLTPKVGESILIPSHGLTIQVEALHRGGVTLKIAVPSRTQVFRMGAFRRRGKAAEL